MEIMFVGGADVSGDKHRLGEQREGERNYISFLVGTEDVINTIYNNIGIDGIHMSELSDKQVEQVRHNLDFHSNDVRVWCFHVQRQHVEDYFINHTKLRSRKIPIINIHKNFDLHLLRSFKNELEKFVFPYHQEFSDIIVQTDSDMGKTVDHWKMKRESKGKALELADAVVWFNQKNIKLDRVMEKDLVVHLKTVMEKDLLR